MASTTATESTTEDMDPTLNSTTTDGGTSTDTETTATGGVAGCDSSLYDVPGPEIGAIAIGINQTTRAGIDIRSGAMLEGAQIGCWSVWLRRVDTDATGDITAVIRRVSDDAVVATFGGISSANELTGTLQEYSFRLPSPHTLGGDDRLLIEYDGPSAIRLGRVDDAFDTNLVRRVIYQNDKYQFGGQTDIMGTMRGP